MQYTYSYVLITKAIGYCRGTEELNVRLNMNNNKLTIVWMHLRCRHTHTPLLPSYNKDLSFQNSCSKDCNSQQIIQYNYIESHLVKLIFGAKLFYVI